jgi:hypothetical protein
MVVTPSFHFFIGLKQTAVLFLFTLSGLSDLSARPKEKSAVTTKRVSIFASALVAERSERPESLNRNRT